MYAPEHLIINVKDAEKWESFIENAGKIVWIFLLGVFFMSAFCNPLEDSILNVSLMTIQLPMQVLCF
jgi:hypothetical protein